MTDERDDLIEEERIARVLRRRAGVAPANPPFEAIEARAHRRTPLAGVVAATAAAVVLALVVGNALAERRAATTTPESSTPAAGTPAPTATQRSSPPQTQPSATARTVRLYYYDSARDRDASGNLLCTAKGLVAVERQIPGTQTPIADTIRLLIRGELTAAERSRGITTDFPLQGLELTEASLAGGVLTLTFSDPDHSTTGGACRTGVLRAQIDATARQFEGVQEVVFRPLDVFQP